MASCEIDSGNREAAKMTRRAGTATMATFMSGIPVETFTQAANTMECAGSIKAEGSCCNLCYPIRGTRLHEEAAAPGLHPELKALGVLVLTLDNGPVEALREIQRHAMKAQKKVLTAMSRLR